MCPPPPARRRVQLPGGRDVILSDTVGFISDLPTQLIEAFQVGYRYPSSYCWKKDRSREVVPALFDSALCNVNRTPPCVPLQATLEEVTQADLLLHVLDASSPHVLDQRRAVLQVSPP